MQKLISALCVLLLLAGCAGRKEQSITVAQQYGTAYAPIAVMRELALLEQELPDSVTVKWVQLANTAENRLCLYGYPPLSHRAGRRDGVADLLRGLPGSHGADYQ